MGESAVKNKRPFGFYVCSIAFMLERMAFYPAKYLIFAFVSATVVTGGLGLTKETAVAIQSNLVAFSYLAPIIGGYFSDRYIGARYCIPVGLGLMGVGYFLGGFAQNAAMMNIMVILVCIGTGLFKGNASAITGSLFSNDEQLDSAFSVQYSFVNVGSFIGTTVVGLLVTGSILSGGMDGFRFAFQLCGALCAIDALWFLFGMRFLGEAGKKPFKAGKHTEKKVETEVKPLTGKEKKRVFAIVLISMFSVAFWVCWYLTYLAAYDYGAAFVNMNVGSFEVPLAWFDSLNALGCIALGPVFGMMWFKMSKRPAGDLSLFKKLALGLAFLAMSFLMLVGAEMTRGIGAPDTAKASIVWLIAFGVLLTIGEMLFSPLGNSFVTKYAPNKLFAVMMGVWTIAVFFSGKLYSPLYNLASSYSVMQSYTVLPAILFGLGVLLFIFDKKLSSLLEDEDEPEDIKKVS